MIKIGIIGGSGYTGGELLRLLTHHPEVVVDFVYSRTRAGQKISQVHPDLLGATKLCFTDQINTAVAVVFLCLGHGYSKAFLTQHRFSKDTKIIDLSTDFRAITNANFLGKTFVYGLPEQHKYTIKKASYIANPGCFATALQLALLPLAKAQKLVGAVHINGTTGSTGAGVIPAETTHYSWRNNNLSWYKAFNHQHLHEVQEQLGQASLKGLLPPLGTEEKSNLPKEAHNTKNVPKPKLYFIPQRGNFTRGIFATLYLPYNAPLETAINTYKTFYKEAPFTQISPVPITLKQVVNTNQCHLHLHKYEDQLLVTVALDNLLKGASGQAVQNMNLILGLKEELGLTIKGSGF